MMETITIGMTENIFDSMLNYMNSRANQPNKDVLVSVVSLTAGNLIFKLPYRVVNPLSGTQQLQATCNEMDDYRSGRLRRRILEYTPDSLSPYIGKRLGEVLSYEKVLNHYKKSCFLLPDTSNKNREGNSTMFFLPPAQVLHTGEGYLFDMRIPEFSVLVDDQWKSFDKVKDYYIREDFSLSETPEVVVETFEEFVFD